MRCRSHLVPAVLLVLLLAPAAPAADTTYLLPPPVIVSILDAPPPPVVVASPRGDVVLVLESTSMPPVAELSRPMLRLAGARIDPATNGPHTRPRVVGLTLKPLDGGAERRIALPAGATAMSLGFSPDGARLAVATFGDGPIRLWVVDVDGAGGPRAAPHLGATAREVAGVALNAAFPGLPCEWLRDSRALLCTAVPAGRGEATPAPAVPTGPNVQETAGTTAPVATFQDLLRTPHDEALFEHYFTSQPILVDASSLRVTPLGTPGIYASLTTSTNGAFVLAERLTRPFSRQVTANRFPKEVEVWSRTGEVIRRVATLPLAENVPINGVPTGPRSYRWHATAPATLVWAEALDKGDPKVSVPHRDRLMSLAAPFTGDPVEWLKTEYRFQSAMWTDRGLALVTEYDRPKRWTRTWLLDGTSAPVRLFDRSAEDRYKDPGTPMLRPGTRTVRQHGTAIYLLGDGASPVGDRPFLDRLDLATRTATRLFQSGDTSYESVAALLADDGSRLLTRYESKTEPPNYVVRGPGGARRAITDYADPAPQLAGVTTQLVTYARKDGVKLSATLHLPPGYQAGQRMPVLMWAYPREFADPDAAGQVSGSPNRFITVRGASHLLLLTQGYAIVDNPSMPIVGPGETANDTYVDQLVAGAEAAIDTVVGMGVADRDRIAIGGHSYGAFMTANLLAHSDLFRAGIARSGAYNRTLTPFGFQNEQRTFWEVPDIYARMSPFWHAHKINEPILLIHGEADNNSGTFPIQSERLYAALKGHGATARYVTLPYESHGYMARESVLHTVAEMLNWCDTYVKNAAPPGAQPSR
jgi:dipeptidyl aminopeptidase/acylaminoacyl peptidase